VLPDASACGVCVHLINEVFMFCKGCNGAPVVFKSLQASGQQVWHQLVVHIHKPGTRTSWYLQLGKSSLRVKYVGLLLVDVQSLVGTIKHPRPVLLVSPILHEGRESSQLGPANEQLLCPTILPTAAPVTTNV